MGTVSDTVLDEVIVKHRSAEEALNDLSKATFSEYLLLNAVPGDASLETIL